MAREYFCDGRNEGEVCAMLKSSQHPSKPTPSTEVPLKFPDNRSHVAVTFSGTIYDALLDTGAVSIVRKSPPCCANETLPPCQPPRFRSEWPMAISPCLQGPTTLR